VIKEELPDAMHAADRFHLHQNLLEAIKKALNREIPARITIPHEQGAATNNSVEDKNHGSKKNTRMFNNLSISYILLALLTS